MGPATAELKLMAGRALQPPELPRGGMEAGAGRRASLEKARRGFTGPCITGEHAGSESGRQLGSLPLSARATWILGPVS